MSEIFNGSKTPAVNDEWDSLADFDRESNEREIFKERLEKISQDYKDKFIKESGGEEQYRKELEQVLEELAEDGIKDVDETLLLGLAAVNEKIEETKVEDIQKDDIVFALMVEQEFKKRNGQDINIRIMDLPSSMILGSSGGYEKLASIAEDSDDETSGLIKNSITEAQKIERRKIEEAVSSYNKIGSEHGYYLFNDHPDIKNALLSAARYGLDAKAEVIDKISRNGQLELLQYKMRRIEDGLTYNDDFSSYSHQEFDAMWKTIGEIKPSEDDRIGNFWYQKQQEDGKDHFTEFYNNVNSSFENTHSRGDITDFIKSLVKDEDFSTLDTIVEKGFSRETAEESFARGNLFITKEILDKIPDEEKSHAERIESKLADLYSETMDQDRYSKGPNFRRFIENNKDYLLKAKSLKNFDRLPQFMHLSQDAEKYLAIMIDDLPEDDKKVKENAKAMADLSDHIRRGLLDDLMVRTELAKFSTLSESDRYIFAGSLASMANSLIGDGVFGGDEWLRECEEYAAKNISTILDESERVLGYRNAEEYIRRNPTSNPASKMIENFYNAMLKKYGKDDFVESTRLVAETFSYDPEMAKNKAFPEAIDDILSQPIYDEKNIKRYAKLVQYIKNSNAEELVKCEKTLTRQLITTMAGQPMSDESYEEAKKKVERIEQIFLKNNLPYVGKVFQTFNILSANSPALAGAMSRGALGKLPEHGARSKEAVLFADLLRAAAGSNNLSLKNYLKNLKIGQNLTEKILANDISVDDLSPEDQSTLETYANHLETLYHNLKKGKDAPKIKSNNLIEKVKKLGQLFDADERKSIPDQVVRNFAYLLGYHSLVEFRDSMTYKTREADLRNRDRLRRGDFKLEPGDLVKSTGIEYIGEILQNGCVSKEFLNGQSETDATPLDTDVGVIPDRLKDKTFPETIEWKNSSTAFGRMHLMVVLKGDQNSGRSRFQFENPQNRFDKTKYEIWDNSRGGSNGDNYGVRVGFPSSEIDFLIYDDFGQSDTYGDLNRIKFEVAKNGFFIPIVDKEGNPVFSEEEYSELRKRMGGLKHYDSGEYNFSELLDSGSNPEISRIMAELPENEAENATKRGLIMEKFADVFRQFGLEIKEHIDGDISGGSVEVLNTGSTGRDSNVRGDGDFDFIVRLNRSDYVNPEKKREILSAIASTFGQEYSENPRWKNVQIGDGETVDLEISYVIKMNRVGYGTEEALKEYYDSMKRQSPEKYQEVLANIIYAKQILKNAEVYGKGPHKQGGLGGAGVENWIIQNGGSFEAARKGFLDAAIDKDTGKIVPFEVFRSKYAIFDFGENHYIEKIGQGANLHDNFTVGNLTAAGYEKMVHVLSEMA